MRPNAIYYITNWTHTAAHANVKNAFEQMGEDKIWADIVTPSQIESINEGMNKLMQGKPINDRRHSRINRRSPRPRRARATPEYLKQEAMKRAEAPKPIDEYLADKWEAVAEGLEHGTALIDVKRRPAA